MRYSLVTPDRPLCIGADRSTLDILRGVSVAFDFPDFESSEFVYIRYCEFLGYRFLCTIPYCIFCLDAAFHTRRRYWGNCNWHREHASF